MVLTTSRAEQDVLRSYELQANCYITTPVDLEQFIAIVVLSGLDDETLAVRAVQEGAQDYLVKGQVDGAAILRSMRYAIERQRLESVRRDLERQRDEFFASVSHDLRTPVAAIKAAIGVVLANMPPALSPQLQRLLGNIDLAADELAGLIEDLLEMARLQSGRVELWRTSVDVRDVIGRAARALEPLIQARGQRLTTAARCPQLRRTGAHQDSVVKLNRRPVILIGLMASRWIFSPGASGWGVPPRA